MSKLRTYELQNPDSASVNIELTPSGGTVLSGVVTATTLKVGTGVTISSGVVSADSFSGPLTGNVTGDLTGNVTGNLTGNVTGDLTGTASTATAAATAYELSGTPNLNVGVITATTYYGSGANLTGIDATALKDSGGNIKIQANTSGAVVTGVLTATTFSGSGSGLTGITTSSISNNAITTAKIADGSITSAKIVSNSTSFDLDRKQLYLPRGFYRYNTDAVSDPHGQLNNMPYGGGYFWSGYMTESGYAANGATVTARLMNGVPAGLVIIELTSASHGGGNVYGNSYGGGCEILAWEPAHHGWAGGSTSVIATRGTLYGSYTTSSGYGVYVTGGTNGTYWRVTFIH